jgi:hypothetical protein
MPGRWVEINPTPSHEEERIIAHLFIWQMGSVKSYSISFDKHHAFSFIAAAGWR